MSLGQVPPTNLDSSLELSPGASLPDTGRCWLGCGREEALALFWKIVGMRGTPGRISSLLLRILSAATSWKLKKQNRSWEISRRPHFPKAVMFSTFWAYLRPVGEWRAWATYPSPFQWLIFSSFSSKLQFQHLDREVTLGGCFWFPRACCSARNF